jgi:DNA modification methylase
MKVATAQPLNIVYKKINSLKVYSNNARTHSKAQIRKIAESIRNFGFTNPLLVDSSDTIIAGHGRVEAAKLLGLDQVPTILLSSLTKSQIRAYVIADNRLLALHPTVKPVSMVADALLDCSAPNNMVLDIFLGSGTTLLAAEQTRRTCFGIELDPKYVDVAVRRWQQVTGSSATHIDSSKTFEDTAHERENENG